MYEKSLLQKQELKNVVDTAIETTAKKTTREIAKNLLKQKLDIHSISQATGLNIEEIEAIAKDLKA